MFMTGWVGCVNGAHLIREYGKSAGACDGQLVRPTLTTRRPNVGPYVRND